MTIDVGARTRDAELTVPYCARSLRLALAASLLGCGSPESTPGAPPEHETPVPHAEPPPAAPAERFAGQGMDIVDQRAPVTTSLVLFDNPTDAPLRLVFDDAELQVESGGHSAIHTGGELSFGASRGQELVQHRQALEPDTLYVYSAGGLRDYVLERARYTSVGLAGSPPPTRFRGQLFFRVGPIPDYLFEPLPQTVMVRDGSIAAAADRTRLGWDGDAHRDRSVRCSPSGPWRCIVEGPSSFALQPEGAAGAAALVYLDSDAAQRRRFAVDGAEVGAIGPRELARIMVPEGVHRFEITGDSRTAVEQALVDGGRYVWNPGGGQRYTETQRAYGEPAFGTDLLGYDPTLRPPTALSEREIFPVRWDLVFEPFPETVNLTVIERRRVLTRLTRRGRH